MFLNIKNCQHYKTFFSSLLLQTDVARMLAFGKLYQTRLMLLYTVKDFQGKSLICIEHQ
jgi:hypothetical protein